MSETLTNLLGSLDANTKLKDIALKPVNPNDPFASWALAWSHYAVAGDALTGNLVHSRNDRVVIGNKTITGENTLGELFTAMANSR